ncbi:P-loop ATPase, Sll1717 family [Clostridium estertheticum]|uniref:P-loop ATPase, Sll1717 family n=1 Tax=Clostridium estertheticum TaxID=238834 RepID=UPI001CF4D70F|nr:hypothetical protein [Clostridium estertheticum]MCB2361991.1 hypothetical protein [Clostridium estertheticum]
MSYQTLEIKDIFVGSIDAKDDVNNSISENEFIENFILPPNFEISDFLEGNKCFVEGYKGTGKTALLNYMSKYVQNTNGLEYFMLFKSDYKNSDKEKLEKIANNIVELDKESLKNETDFEYIWRWVILNKIVQFNLKNNYRVFEKNKEWDKFEKVIKSLSNDKNSRSFFDLLPFKINKIGQIGYSVNLGDSDIVHSLGIKNIEFESKGEMHIEFSNLLEKSFDLFSKLTLNDKSSYIFIDELEAFYEEPNMFKRDLRMIRDLILTVKYFNDLFIEMNFKNIKVICAVRTEVLESIKKFVATKEINKVIYSFRKELKWNYSNTIAYQHPIIQIWLKRIKMAEKKCNGIELSDAKIMDKWFDKQINSDDIVPYILDNSWHKPRDVVRLLQSASNISPNSIKYDQNVFNRLRKEYSKESWKEIFEELNIMYRPEQIEDIRDFLMCYKRYFTFEEAKFRAKLLSEQKSNNFLFDNIRNILKDLYRVGCIGNMSMDKRYYRWQHKGDDSLVIDDTKLFMFVHSGLWSELSLFYVYADDVALQNLKIGQVVMCRVNNINKSFAHVAVLDSTIIGSIHIKNLFKGNRFIKNINDIVKVGEVFQAKILEVNIKFGLILTRFWE